MNLRSAFGPVLALLILALISIQTNDALHRSGTWGGPRRKTSAPAPDPYARLEADLSAPGSALPQGLRDPFSYGRTADPIVRPVRTYTPPPPAAPLLTAILTGDESRALVRYRDHDYSVRPGDQFAEFKVLSITPEQVVLDHGGQRLVLSRPTKGEQ